MYEQDTQEPAHIYTMLVCFQFNKLCENLKVMQVKENSIQSIQNAIMQNSLNLKIDYTVEEVPKVFNR